ncbi:hypothetical protein MA13_contig00020-0007 [Edwardsiella piscicida]|nr:hypothetical protein MA13_contig00020-0007 [Edwardsiella piscicida]
MKVETEGGTVRRRNALAHHNKQAGYYRSGDDGGKALAAAGRRWADVPSGKGRGRRCGGA